MLYDTHDIGRNVNQLRFWKYFTANKFSFPLKYSGKGTYLTGMFWIIAHIEDSECTLYCYALRIFYIELIIMPQYFPIPFDFDICMYARHNLDHHKVLYACVLQWVCTTEQLRLPGHFLLCGKVYNDCFHTLAYSQLAQNFHNSREIKFDRMLDVGKQPLLVGTRVAPPHL